MESENINEQINFYYTISFENRCYSQPISSKDTNVYKLYISKGVISSIFDEEEFLKKNDYIYGKIYNSSEDFLDEIQKPMDLFITPNKDKYISNFSTLEYNYNQLVPKTFLFLDKEECNEVEREINERWGEKWDFIIKKIKKINKLKKTTE